MVPKLNLNLKSDLAISFFSEKVKIPLFQKSRAKVFLRNIILDENHKPGDISIIFCSDNHLLSINKKYLEHDYYTDIITFDYSEGKVISGDIFISIDRVKENALKFQVTLDEELHRIMCHGVLHLLGVNDRKKAEKEEMTRKENHYLNKFLFNN